MRQWRNQECLWKIFLLGILCLCPVPVLSSSSSPWKGAPWQTRDDGLIEQPRYNELPPTVFSPTGRLHPVERTMEQLRDLQSNLVVAVHCKDGMLILSTIPLSPYLNTTLTPLKCDNSTSKATLFLIQNDENQTDDNTLPILDLSPNVVAATAGKPLDSQVLRLRIQALAQQLIQDDLDLPARDDVLAMKLARSLADQLQMPTQKTNTRQGPLLACAAIVMGNRQLWRIDPTGQFWNCHGAIMGRESDRAEEAIVTKLLEVMATKENKEDLGTFLRTLTCEDTLEMVCECLQNVFWPSSLNLHTLPAGVRATIPSIPWVAVALPEIQSSSSRVPTRVVRRGAFLPSIASTSTSTSSTDENNTNDDATEE